MNIAEQIEADLADEQVRRANLKDHFVELMAQFNKQHMGKAYRVMWEFDTSGPAWDEAGRLRTLIVLVPKDEASQTLSFEVSLWGTVTEITVCDESNVVYKAIQSGKISSEFEDFVHSGIRSLLRGKGLLA